MLPVKKHSVLTVSLAIWQICLHENNHNYNSYRFSDEFFFYPFFSFLKNQKQESKFQQIRDLLTKHISVPCL